MSRSLHLLALCGALTAQSASALTQDDVLEGALLPGYPTETGQMAGLQLTLTPGWKTYWRAPGEAGIPPVFDWSGSENVKSVRVHWPTPSVFQTNGLQVIGYHDQVLLPLEVTPQDPSKPMRLVGEMALGVCKDICMPAQLDLTADLNVTSDAEVIKSALRALPDQLNSVARCEISFSKHGFDIKATIQLARFGASEVVAIETADPTLWVGPSDVSRQGATLSATATIYAPAGAVLALDRSGISLTVLANDRAVEIKGCPAP